MAAGGEELIAPLHGTVRHVQSLVSSYITVTTIE